MGIKAALYVTVMLVSLLNIKCAFHPCTFDNKGSVVSEITSKQNFSTAEILFDEPLESFGSENAKNFDMKIFDYSKIDGILKIINKNKNIIISKNLYARPTIYFKSDSSIIFSFCSGRYFFEVPKHDKYTLWSKSVELKIDSSGKVLSFVAPNGKVGLIVVLSSEKEAMPKFNKKISDFSLSDGIEKKLCDE